MNNKLNQNEKLEIKPLLCEVAVICPRYLDFKLWLRENEKPNERYTLIQRIDNVRGRMFDRVEKLYKYYEIQDIDDVLSYLETHMRTKPICKHQNVKREDGLDECLDCGIRNY